MCASPACLVRAGTELVTLLLGLGDWPCSARCVSRVGNESGLERYAGGWESVTKVANNRCERESRRR